MPSLSTLGPSFYDTYRARTAENEQAGMRDLQQIGSLLQLQNTVKAQRDDQQLKSMLEQSGGNLEAVVQGALRAGRPDIAAKLAPLIEAQRKAQPQAQSIGSGGLRLPDGTIVPPAARPAAPAAPSSLGKLMEERKALPEGDPRIRVYDAAIAKMSERTPAAEKTYPIVTSGDGIFERRPEGLVQLKDPKTGQPLKPTARERPITEYQGKNALYGTRAQDAHKTLLELEDKINVTGLAAKQGAENVPVIGGLLGAAGNTMLSKSQQKVEQAQRNFVNAVLRQESGAVISEPEFQNAKKQYFPQPGDTKEVIEQKRRNRMIAIDGFKKLAGPAWSDTAGQEPASGGWSITPVK